jgi:hypothetical protein
MPAPAFIQGLSTTAFGNASTNAQQFTLQNTTPGAMQILVLCTNPQTDTISSVTDTEGNSANWVIGPKITYDATVLAVHIAYCLHCIGGTKNTITAHISGSITSNGMCIGEYSNVSALRSQDTSNTSGSSTAPLSGAISVVIGDLLIGYLGTISSTSQTAGTGMTTIEETTGTGAGASNVLSLFADGLAVSTTANQKAGFTLGSITTWGAGILAFAPAGAGGGSKSWLTVAAANALRGLRH